MMDLCKIRHNRSKTFLDGTRLSIRDLEVHDGELWHWLAIRLREDHLTSHFQVWIQPPKGKYSSMSGNFKTSPGSKRFRYGLSKLRPLSTPYCFQKYIAESEKSNLSKFDKEEQVQKVAIASALPTLMRKPSRFRVDKDKGHWRLLARNPSIHLLDEPLATWTPTSVYKCAKGGATESIKRPPSL